MHLRVCLLAVPDLREPWHFLDLSRHRQKSEYTCHSLIAKCYLNFETGQQFTGYGFILHGTRLTRIISAHILKFCGRLCHLSLVIQFRNRLRWHRFEITACFCVQSSRLQIFFGDLKYSLEVGVRSQALQTNDYPSN
jgi:hypothetical protein